MTEQTNTRTGQPARHRHSIATVTVALLAVAVAGCSSSSKSADSGPSSTSPGAASVTMSTTSTADAGNGSSAALSGTYKVLTVVDTSGAASFYGAQESYALKGAADYWNAHGGVGHKKVSMNFVDANSDASTAVTSLLAWVSSHGKPDLIVDALGGADDSGLAPAIKRLGVMAIGSDASNACSKNASQTCPHQFAAGPDTAKVTSLATAQWLKAQGYKKVGILAEQDQFDQGEATGDQAALTKVGVKSVVASFATTAVDVSPQLAQVTSQHVDVLLASGVGPAAGYIATARLNAGKVQSLPLLFGLAASAQDLTKLVAAAGLVNAHELIGRVADISQKIPGVETMYASASKYGAVNQPLAISNMWDAMVLAHDAAEQANSTTPDAMTNALLNLDDKYKNDRLFAYTSIYGFSNDARQDVLALPSTYTIVKVGALNAKGQVVSPK